MYNMFINHIDECFTVKYSTRTIFVRNHSPESEWSIFNILTGEDIGDIIFHFFHGCLAKNSQFVFMLNNKKK